MPFANLTSGYVLRAIDQFPKQGAGDPWRREQNYAREWRAARRTPVDDPALEFGGRYPDPDAGSADAALSAAG